MDPSILDKFLKEDMEEEYTLLAMGTLILDFGEMINSMEKEYICM